MKLTYSEFWFWNIVEDEDQVRLSFFHNGQEYFCLIAAGGKYRARRDRAAEVVAEIIQSGGEPGDHTDTVRLALLEDEASRAH